MEDFQDETNRKLIEHEFSWLQDECYLDFAGAGLYSKRQIEDAAKDISNNLYGNPHSLSVPAKLSSQRVQNVRHRVLEFFNTNSSEYTVVFTSGATAAIKLVLESFDWGGGAYAYTATNHTSVLGGRLLALQALAPVFCLPDHLAETIFEENVNSGSKRRNGLNNSLFAYPAQCNFSGKKYPLNWVAKTHAGALDGYTKSSKTTWYCLLDAATFCSTNPLNLSEIHPDFVCVSFYKLLGYPTGLGALLVRNASAHVLHRNYFGGGTVDLALPSGDFVKLRSSIAERFEDGSVDWLSIIQLWHGFETLTRLNIKMSQVAIHVFNLARHVALELSSSVHWNGKHFARIYTDSNFEDFFSHGGIVAFNLYRADGSCIGYSQVLHVLSLHKIHVRTGCFCNLGACQRFLQLTDHHLLSNLQEGHVCGDERDLVNGRPTGAVRVSFGYPSLPVHAQTLLTVLRTAFLEKSPTSSSTVLLQRDGSEPRLSKICLFPVKSCRAVEVTGWRLTSKGLEFDREWMVTSSGVCLTQKQEPLLCKIQPSVDVSTATLTLSFSGDDAITVPCEGDIEVIAKKCTNRICGDRVETTDCGDAVADWLCKHLNRDNLRLVRQVPSHGRTAKRSNNSSEPVISLANQAQYLVINEASVSMLSKHLDDDDGFDTESLRRRFRANFLISGPEALNEIEWKSLQIGHLKFQVDGPCSRCQMICIDQDSGEKNRRPLVELSRALGGRMRFGVYCSHLQLPSEAFIQVGDPVVIST